ncbi:hypothetical protein ACQJBY_039986 [Aegilops geniculata]
MSSSSKSNTVRVQTTNKQSLRRISQLVEKKASVKHYRIGEHKDFHYIDFQFYTREEADFVFAEAEGCSVLGTMVFLTHDIEPVANPKGGCTMEYVETKPDER